MESFAEETKIYYGFPTNIILIMAGAPTFGVVSVLWLKEGVAENAGFSGLACIALLALGAWEWKKRSGRPQIVLNAKGIQIDGRSFAPWSDIRHARIGESNTTKSLCFEHNGEKVVHPLFDLKVDVAKLEQMLVFYRNLNK